MRRNQSGFTLIEIAIVLVIIGLLLGGVLKGQEMITSAKVKNLANDFKNTQTLLYAYQDKFKSFPGDDVSAASHVAGGTKASTNGTAGNGIIEGDWNSATATDESYLFWQHLSLAGLSTGGATPPTHAFGGLMGATASGVPITGLPGSFFVCAANIPGKIMMQLDTTLDDGNPTTGTMRASKTSQGTANAASSYTVGTDDNTMFTVCQGS